MTTSYKKLTSDFSYSDYQERQQAAILPENIEIQANEVSCSDKFVFSGSRWNIAEYKGFAINSMVLENPDNEELFGLLKHIKKQLEDSLNQTPSWYFLPEDSYHQTIANLLSDKRFYEKILTPGLSQVFPEVIKKVFDAVSCEKQNKPLKMEMLGLSVFGSCIALLGKFNSTSDYLKITGFREKIYHFSVLNNLGIRWTRPFIGHITLAYLGKNYNTAEKAFLAQAINEINKSFSGKNPVFNIGMTQLKCYNDLTCFKSIQEFPSFEFIS